MAEITADVSDPAAMTTAPCLAVSGAHYGHGESRCHPHTRHSTSRSNTALGEPARLAPDVGWLRVER